MSEDTIPMSDIDGIKAEIKTEISDYEGCADFNEGIRFGLRTALEIIDKHMAIKALEQEPCEDAISRSQTLSDYADWFGYGYADNTFYKRLKSMPSVQPKVAPQEPKWIPVSERLPEDGKEVLTCSGGGFIEIQSIEDVGGKCWENQHGDWSDIEDVVAWMHLPQPYRAESEGKE